MSDEDCNCDLKKAGWRNDCPIHGDETTSMPRAGDQARQTQEKEAMSDTPETDREAFRNGALSVIPADWVSGDFARRLERERDEACERLNEVGLERNIALSELDEARRELKEKGGVHSCHANCQRPLCVARRERDEARRALRILEPMMRLHACPKCGGKGLPHRCELCLNTHWITWDMKLAWETGPDTTDGEEGPPTTSR